MPRSSFSVLLSALALLSTAPHGALAQQSKPTSTKPKAGAATGGPVARYSIDADTSTSLNMRMPSMGALLGGAAVGFETTTTRSLSLSLDSRRRPSGTPQAEHRIPSGLQLGASLPLASGEPGPEGPTQKDPMPSVPDVKARILHFWGCGAQAGPGQPAIEEIVLSQEKLQQILQRMRKNLSGGPRPDAAVGTSGIWPTIENNPKIPLTASLAGDHTVSGNYTPELRFSLSASQDFLAPVTLKTSPEGGALLLSWNQVPYIVGTAAAVNGKGVGSNDVVIWTSSSYPEKSDKAKDLLPPERTSCVMSAEARKAMELPTASLTAYGIPVTLRGPDWQVNLERSSSATVPPLEGIDAKGAEQPAAPKGGGGLNPFKLF